MEEIRGFERYLVTRDGVIFNKKSNRRIKCFTRKDGYQQCTLRQNKKPKIVYIHRIVAIQFLINDEARWQVNHKNGIKNDNRVENLEWVTPSENTIHAYKTGLKTPKLSAYEKVAISNRVVSEDEENIIKEMAKHGHSFRHIGRALGYHHKTISGIVNQTSNIRARPDNRNKIWQPTFIDCEQKP
jgi:hypothetical protein